LHITSLEIDNFKSFVKKTKIPFYDGFTVISGPNGSGKSNIIDSILFVLALSGSRTLRAEKLTDLINLNSGKNTAEVTITFSDGTRIRRRIKRTENGYYSYNYLNDRVCKQADVTAFLSQFGIIPHGYNVVMQGDITRIIEMSDFERRKIIDEIAGVAEFDAKRDQALQELEVVRERIEREEMILHELAERMEELAKEREQALAYREWQEKLDYYQSCRAAASLRDKEKELGSLARLIADQQTALSGILSDRGLEEHEISYLRADLKEIDDQINEKSGSEYLRLIAELEEAKGSIRVSEQSISRLEKERGTVLESINRCYVDMKRAESRVAELTQSIRELSIDRTNLAMEAATARAQVEKIQGELEKESKDTEGARDELFALMKEVEEKKAGRSSVLHQQDMLIEKSRMRTSEKERLEERLRVLNEDAGAQAAQAEEFSRQVTALEEEREELDRELSALEGAVFARRSTLERARNELKAVEQEVIRLEAQQQARGEGGSRAMEAVMGMEGIYGTLAQLGKAAAEYSTALNVAAGGKLQYVVAKDDAKAAGAISYLKDQKLGRLTFLPLNKMRPLELPRLKEEGVIDYAVNLLEFEPAYADAFRVALGGTVVVRSLDRARALMGRYRMVTIEGELLEKSGAMTGGSFKRPVKGFGAAVEDEIGRLRAQLAEMGEEVRELEQGVTRGTATIEEQRAKRNEITQNLDRARMMMEEFTRRQEAFTGEKDAVNADLSRIAEEVKTGAAELAALEASLDAMTEEINRVGKKIDQIKKRLEDTAIPALTESLEKKRREQEDIERRLRNKESDIGDLSRERQHFSSRVDELRAENERYNEKNREIDAEVAGAKGQIESAREQIRELEERQKQFSSELAELRSQHDRVADSITASEKKILEFDAAAEKVRIQVQALEERQFALSTEIDALRAEVGDITTELTLQEIEDHVSEASLAIRKIGAVNMLAIEEYDRVRVRVDERTERKETLSRERSSLIERIEHFEKMKFEAFMEAFRAIDANFREVFARLTSGNGHLILENEEDPFAGGLSFAVQPRDKPVHLLSALSGGEKSLTTLAFIFSIQQYIPAPFYAFDEVDMSLDGSNVERIGEMIRELSKTSQFVIVSLRKPMLEGADRLVGVTLLSDKSSFVTGIKVND
jgi:chromosome segregation protein